MSMTDDTLKAHRQFNREEELRKADATYTLATNLVPVDLQAPAKHIYPVNVPILRSLPRIGGGMGKATEWKEITSIDAGLMGSPWVPEGVRAGRGSITLTDKLATYRTIGEEDDLTDEAIETARGFQDAQALQTRITLERLKLKQESILAFGNSSVALGTPTAPTVASATSGGSIAADTYDVRVVLLTGEGWRNSSVANGVVQVQTVTSADGSTYNVNGGSSNKSAATQKTTTGANSTLSCSVDPVQGAVAYAWYVGATGGNVTLQAITTISSVKLTSLTTTNQNVTAITADCSRNTTTAYDGLMYYPFNSSTDAYYRALATGTPGTGTTLTSAGNGRVVEIDTMLRDMWNNYQITPDVIYCNAQELETLSDLMTTGTSTVPIVQYNAQPGQAPVFIGGPRITMYQNLFTTGGNDLIPIMLHPHIPAGTILAWANSLPTQYKTSNTPRVAEVRTLKDYHQYNWPMITRKREFGVYAMEVLVVYAPRAIGAITNIGNG